MQLYPYFSLNVERNINWKSCCRSIFLVVDLVVCSSLVVFCTRLLYRTMSSFTTLVLGYLGPPCIVWSYVHMHLFQREIPWDLLWGKNSLKLVYICTNYLSLERKVVYILRINNLWFLVQGETKQINGKDLDTWEDRCDQARGLII